MAMMITLHQSDHHCHHDDNDGNDDHSDEEDHDEDNHSDEDNHDDGDDHGEEEGHCSGPEGLIHCILTDFGGEDECMDLEEFIAAWGQVGMEGEPQTDFFDNMDIDSNGCISEHEITKTLEIMGEKCMPAEETTEAN